MKELTRREVIDRVLVTVIFIVLELAYIALAVAGFVSTRKNGDLGTLFGIIGTFGALANPLILPAAYFIGKWRDRKSRSH